MADALTGLALYSALAEQVYRWEREKDKADQPLAVLEDGSKPYAESLITGQTLANPRLNLELNTNPLTASRFTFDNNYIYGAANGLVAMGC